MAIRFDAATDYITRNTNMPPATTQSLLFRLYLDVDRNAVGTLYLLYDGGTNYQGIFLSTSDGTSLVVETNNGFTSGTSLSTGTWYDVAYVRNGANHTLYLNGVVDISRTDNNSLTPASMFMGSEGTNFLNGRLADIILYDVALTQAEIVNQMRVKSPRRRSNINGWYPTFAGATERTRDYSGNGRNWTEAGTPSDNDNPGISWGEGSLLVPFVGASVPTETQEGYRFRNDDGSETTATWAAAQDTPATVDAETPIRLRMLIDATNNPSSGAYKLQYREVGDVTWKDVL